MDSLTPNERRLAWLRVWKTSFSGYAIIGKDMRFRAVSEQFCFITKTTPAAWNGKKFTDFTHIGTRELDEQNAQLIIEGTIRSYIISKTLELGNGNQIDVIWISAGVYSEKTGDFLYFVSSIMENKKSLTVNSSSQKPIELLDWIDRRKVGMGILASAAAIGYGAAKLILEKI